VKYNEQLLLTLEEDEFSCKQRLAYKLEQVCRPLYQYGFAAFLFEFSCKQRLAYKLEQVRRPFYQYYTGISEYCITSFEFSCKQVRAHVTSVADPVF
jgi:hypothetical protein